MNQFKCLLLAAAMVTAGTSLTACDDGDEDSTENPAEETVLVNKQNDTAILLCTFGSTFEEAVDTYDAVLADFESAFPNTDIYLSFTSRTCVNRVEAETGIARYQPDLWLAAIGEAGYSRVAVQSLHIIPGEEYLSLMNTDVKKNFMISSYPSIEVVKGTCLVYDEDDAEDVADVLYDAYADVLSSKTNIVLLMGHGNPDTNYNANSRYTMTEEALQARATNENIFIGTVDYGEMLFWPEDSDEPNDGCIYSKLVNYCEVNNLEPSDITVYLAPFMSIAGDHAHNDLWGVEDGDDYSDATPDSDNCWRLRLLYMGFNINTDESHNGSADDCTIKGLGDYAAIRQIWVNHLSELYNDDSAWETGEDYQ